MNMGASNASPMVIDFDAVVACVMSILSVLGRREEITGETALT
jgi:hypothetical protein